MKKHGEFMCPRCKGISNIKLSPLVYVCAILAVAAGFLIYFFAKFILDNISIVTPLYVLIPFAVFFLISLFFVYLEKPVIRKVRKSADGKYYDENGNEMKMRMGKLVFSSDVDARSYSSHNDNYRSRSVNSAKAQSRQEPVRNVNPGYKRDTYNQVRTEEPAKKQIDAEDLFQTSSGSKQPKTERVPRTEQKHEASRPSQPDINKKSGGKRFRDL